MTVADISKLTLLEKFDLMRALWEEVQPHLETTEVPLEHRRLLDERRARVAGGQSSILDWNEVKHTLGKP